LGFPVEPEVYRIKEGILGLHQLGRAVRRSWLGFFTRNDRLLAIISAKTPFPRIFKVIS
jgi:hypothetical protein